MNARQATRQVIQAYCLAHLDEEGYVRPLQKEIAVALGVSRWTVNQAIKALRKDGVLRHVGHRWEQACRHPGCGGEARCVRTPTGQGDIVREGMAGGAPPVQGDPVCR